MKWRFKMKEETRMTENSVDLLIEGAWENRP